MLWLCLMSRKLVEQCGRGGLLTFGLEEENVACGGESAEMSKFLFPLSGSAAPPPSNSCHVINRLITIFSHFIVSLCFFQAPKSQFVSCFLSLSPGLFSPSFLFPQTMPFPPPSRSLAPFLDPFD